MDGAGGEKDVNPRHSAQFQGFPSAIDVGVVAAGQAADRGAADVGGDFANRLEIAGRGDRKAGLDDVDAQIDQRLGDLHLLGQVHARAGRLLAVAERGVEDFDDAPFGHDRLLTLENRCVDHTNPKRERGRAAWSRCLAYASGYCGKTKKPRGLASPDLGVS